MPTSSWVDAQHPSILATVNPSTGYYPNGALHKLTTGNGLTETNVYNSRLQPCRMNINSSAVLSTCAAAVPSGNIQDFNYGYNLGTADNGNIASMVGVGTQSFNRTYSYDALNRLSTMADSASNQGCKGLRWTYDAWGNRTNQAVTSGSCFTFSAAATTQNRLVGFQYDAAGNLINDGSHTYTYDAENRIIKVDGGSTATYAYDADGLRVTKTTGGSWTDYLYDLSSRQITEIIPNSWRTAYVYFGGGLLAQYQNSTTSFVYSDHLGSTRIVGNLNGTVHDSMDYLPFGEQIFGDTATTHKFTGKERDAESGLDDFVARHYSSSLGRFMQPDPLFATPLHVVNPQKWNMYAYVVNNPTNYIDPDGKDAIAVNFVNEVPLGGHEGIIVVHADGSATYARFGPQHAASPADAGKVTVQALSPVKFQSNGLPTDASYKELAAEVAKIEGENPNSVGFNYFKTSEADSIALDNWMQEWKNHEAPDYNVTTQNCATFCLAGLTKAGVLGYGERVGYGATIPNRLFMLLMQRATENWTWQGRTPKEHVSHKICWTDDKGEKHCR